MGDVSDPGQTTVVVIDSEEEAELHEMELAKRRARNAYHQEVLRKFRVHDYHHEVLQKFRGLASDQQIEDLDAFLEHANEHDVATLVGRLVVFFADGQRFADTPLAFIIHYAMTQEVLDTCPHCGVTLNSLQGEGLAPPHHDSDLGEEGGSP